MQVFFDYDFLAKINTLGHSVVLSKYRIAINPVSTGVLSSLSEGFSLTNPFPNLPDNPRTLYVGNDYSSLESIWNLETSTLDITIDFSSEPPSISTQISRQSSPFVVIIYYNEIGFSTLRPALYLYNLSESFKFQNLNLIVPGKNHFSIEFPESTLSNVLESTSDNEVEFLETTVYSAGDNIFNTELNDKGDLVAKETYYKYIRSKISDDNNDPIYLNKDGKKIVEGERFFKYYKKIRIKAKNLTGTFDKSGNYTYFITGKANSVNIIGTLVYDYYKIANGVFTKVGSDLVEDLTVDVVLKMQDGGDSIFTISQANKTISYVDSNDGDVSNSTFYPIKYFKDELVTKDYISISDFNTITFVRYSSWITWANTNFSQEYKNSTGSVLYPLFMLDYLKDSPDSTGIYSLAIAKKVDNSVLTNIKSSFHVQSDSDVWDSYFNFDLKYNEADSSDANGYRYDIILSPKKDNLGGNFYPAVNSESKLILCWFVLGSTTIYFYVIQRPKPSQLLLKSQYFVDYTLSQISDLGDEKAYALSLPGSIGAKSVSFYVSDNLRSSVYGSWFFRESTPEYVSEQLSNGVYKYSGDGKLTYIYRTGQTSSLGTINTTISPTNSTSRINQKTFLGYVTVSRQKSDGSGYDPNDWVDAMYCDKKNDIKVAIYLEADQKFNKLCSIRSTTPYFYNSEDGVSSRLYIFRWGKEEKTTLDDGTPSINYIPDDTQSFYFITEDSQDIEDGRIKITSNENWIVSVSPINSATLEQVGSDRYYIYQVDISPINYNTSDMWIGSLDVTSPQTLLPITVSFSYHDGTNEDGTSIVKTYDETFYCVEAGKINPISVYTDRDLQATEFTYNSETPLITIPETVDLETFNTKVVPELKAGDIVKHLDKYYKISARSYSKVTDISYLYEGASEFSGFTHSKNYYICSPIASDSFIYWVVTDYDAAGLKLSGKSGELNEEPVYSEELGGYTFVDSPKSLVVSSNVSDSNDLISFNPIKLSRYSSNSGTLTYIDYLKDWKYSLYKDSGVADGSLSTGLKPINTGNIVTYTDYFQDRDTSELALTYIGLYRLTVKSEVRCRVVLSDFNSNLKFFDESTNSIMKTTLQKDIDPSTNENGVPVYFAFTGGESDAFISESVTDKLFSTTITITQIDHPSISKTLTIRRYYNEISVVDSVLEITSTRLHSTIEKRKILDSDFISGDRRDIFLVRGGSNVFSLSIYSTIETSMLISREGLSQTSSHVFDVNYYDTNRGYMYSSINLSCDFSKVSGAYPIDVYDVISIIHPNAFDSSILGQSNSYLVYCIKSKPNLYVTDDLGNANPSGSTVVVPSNSSKSFLARVGSEVTLPLYSDTPNSNTNSQYLSIENSSLSFVTPANIDYGVYQINMSSKKDNTTESNIFLGTSSLTANIKYDLFIRDEEGNIRTDYTQEEVNLLVGTNTLILSVYQAAYVKPEEPEPEPIIPGILNYRPISAYGEQRDFQFSQTVVKVTCDEESKINGVVPMKTDNEDGSSDTYFYENILTMRFFGLTYRNAKTDSFVDGYDYKNGYEFFGKGQSVIAEKIFEWNKVLPDNFSLTTYGDPVSSKTDDQSLNQDTFRYALVVGYSIKYHEPGSTRDDLIYRVFLGTGEDYITLKDATQINTPTLVPLVPADSNVNKLGNMINVTRQLRHNTEEIFLMSVKIPTAIIKDDGTIDKNQEYLFTESGTSMSSILANHQYCSSEYIDTTLSGDIISDCSGSLVNCKLSYVTAQNLNYDEVFYIRDRYGNRCTFWVHQNWPNDDNTYEA